MHRLAITCTILAACTIPACGRNDRPAVVPVQGRVYYRDQPVAGARVTFLNADAPRAATGKTDQDGHFRLSTFEPNDGAVPGNHAVTVVQPPANTPAATTDLEGAEYQQAMQQVISGPRGAAKQNSPIPAKYAHPQTSGLTFEIRPGEAQTIEVRLAD